MQKWLADLLNSTAPTAGIDPARAYENRAKPAKLSGAKFEIKNAADDAADIYLYGDIGWYDITAQMVAQALADVTAKTLNVRINSSGGSVFEGVAIYNVLRKYAKDNGAKVVTYNDALAASIASVIFMAGDERIIAKNAMTMIHRASGGCYGDADDMKATAQVLESIENDMIVLTYVAKTGQKAADLIDMMKQSTWMNAQTCVDKGFATALAEDGDAQALLRDGMFDNVPDELKNRVQGNVADATALAEADALAATASARIRTRTLALGCDV